MCCLQAIRFHPEKFEITILATPHLDSQTEIQAAQQLPRQALEGRGTGSGGIPRPPTRPLLGALRSLKEQYLHLLMRHNAGDRHSRSQAQQLRSLWSKKGHR